MKAPAPFLILCAAIALSVPVTGHANPVIELLRPSLPTYIKQHKTFELPIIDGALIIGKLQVDMAIQFGNANELDHANRNWEKLREQLTFAMSDFVNVRVSPDRPVNAERLSATLQKALVKAGYPKAKPLVQHIKAEQAYIN